MSVKEQLYQHCKMVLENRHNTIKSAIQDIQNSLGSETKSSAGDKHETGRAMLQLEREKAGQQLAELQTQIEILKKINPELSQQNVALGSIVKTSGANYFIAVSIGEVKMSNQLFYAISAATPIGKLLLSKQVGDTINFRMQKFTILEIL